MENTVLPQNYACDKCKNTVNENAKYCPFCGERVFQSKSAINEVFSKRLKLIFSYYFISLSVIVLLYATDFQVDTTTALISDGIFAIITLAFVINNFKEIKPLFSFLNVRLKIVLVLLICEFILAFSVSHLAEFLNHELFNKSFERYYYMYMDSPSPFLFSLISIAIFPAVFEELGFRGVLFNHLSKITTIGSTIIVSSAFFAIIHLSLISLLWILPLGLAFAFLRNKYQTLWYGIIGHFFYNGFIILLEFIYDGMLF